MKDIRCTHGCTHYHPKEGIDDRCDVHHWAWSILDTDQCVHYNGKRWNPPKPKRIKQPKTGWQTGMEVFNDFPYRCQSFQDNQRSHLTPNLYPYTERYTSEDLPAEVSR